MGFLDAFFRSKDQIVNGRHHFNACREMGFEQSIDGMKMYFLCKSMMFPATVGFVSGGQLQYPRPIFFSDVFYSQIGILGY